MPCLPQGDEITKSPDGVSWTRWLNHMWLRTLLNPLGRRQQNWCFFKHNIGPKK